MYLAQTLTHYFYPRYSNDHKAKVLHNSSLLLLVLFLIGCQIVLRTFPISGLKILGYAANISPSQVISLTNQERINAGLAPLEYSSVLSQAAKIKGEHMLEKDYWSHVAPDGTEPWIFFTNAGYRYRYAGENLARDFPDPGSAIDAWMASPSHRENLLSVKYKEIGIAVVEGDLNGVETTIIVQLFGTKVGDTVAQVPITQAKSQTSFTPTLAPMPTSAPVVARVVPEPSPSGEKITSLTSALKKEAGGLRILVSPFETTKNISLITIGLILLIMVVDGLVVARRRIARIGGRTFAHLAFMGMVLALVLIAKAGQVL